MVAITVVSDLKPFNTMWKIRVKIIRLWKIRVKIIRLWKQHSVVGGLTIEMVLIDSNGVKSNAFTILWERYTMKSYFINHTFLKFSSVVFFLFPTGKRL
ncbi:hypothetical protein DY000_02063230 [Brassica cretica]|uniref:Replication protein A 70 kDa DNA-binding subunit B/D first OB fold domain-containing protein n=1 Tax=Brassica cretica TaxID=69181 RepID=A0ABQ7B0Y2_BRACR|nr:hypothetical protein DY000_02063230 [Brassica cretica]